MEPSGNSRVARGNVATVEIGIEVKILSKAMIKQIGRVSELSHVYNKTTLMTESLQSRRCGQASAESFEIEILLKNALRIFRDAMAHLPQ